MIRHRTAKHVLELEAQGVDGRSLTSIIAGSAPHLYHTSTWDRTDRPTVSSTGDQNIEKGHNTGITSVADDRKEADILKEANEYINEQYMKMY